MSTGVVGTAAGRKVEPVTGTETEEVPMPDAEYGVTLNSYTVPLIRPSTDSDVEFQELVTVRHVPL